MCYSDDNACKQRARNWDQHAINWRRSSPEQQQQQQHSMCFNFHRSVYNTVRHDK